MPTTTRANIKALAKTFCNEKSDAFWNSIEQNTLCNEANRMVYRRLIAACPDQFVTTTNITYPANTEYITFTGASYLNAQPYKMVMVTRTSSSGSTTNSNQQSRLTECKFTELVSLQRREGADGYFYCIIGNYMYVAPIPDTALYLHVYWIPQLDDFTDDTTVCLGGNAQPFQSAVGYALAYLMNIKQDGANSEVHKLWKDAEEDIKAHGNSRYEAGALPAVAYFGPRRPGRP